jgi:hypothetical protein
MMLTIPLSDRTTSELLNLSMIEWSPTFGLSPHYFERVEVRTSQALQSFDFHRFFVTGSF